MLPWQYSIHIATQMTPEYCENQKEHQQQQEQIIKENNNKNKKKYQ